MPETFAQISARTGITNPALLKSIQEKQKAVEPKPAPTPAPTPAPKPALAPPEGIKDAAPATPAPTPAPKPAPAKPTTEQQLTQKYGVTVILSPSNTLIVEGIGDTGIRADGTVASPKAAALKLSQIQKLGILSPSGQKQITAYLKAQEDVKKQTLHVGGSMAFVEPTTGTQEVYRVEALEIWNQVETDAKKAWAGPGRYTIGDKTITVETEEQWMEKVKSDFSSQGNVLVYKPNLESLTAVYTLRAGGYLEAGDKITPEGIEKAVNALGASIAVRTLRDAGFKDANRMVTDAKQRIEIRKDYSDFINKKGELDIVALVSSYEDKPFPVSQVATDLASLGYKDIQDTLTKARDRQRLLTKHEGDIIALAQDLRKEGKTEGQITTYLTGLGFTKEATESTAWWAYATPEQKFNRMVEQDPTLKGAVYAGESKEHRGMPTYYPPDSDIAKLIARFEDPKANPLWKMAAFKGVVSGRELKRIRDKRQTLDFGAELDELTPSQQGEVLQNYASWLKAKGVQDWEFGAVALGAVAELAKEKITEFSEKYWAEPGVGPTIDAVGGFATTVAVGLAMLPMLPGLIVTKPRQTVTGIGRFLKDTTIGAAKGEAWAIGGFVAIAAPFVPAVVRGVKGIHARVRPDTMPGSAASLVADVGRVRVPKGMSDLAARQLLSEVEILGAKGKLPASRLRALDGVPKVDSISVTRTRAGVSDIKLKSADGNVVGHVSGTMRVMSDVIYHGTADTLGIIREARQRGFDTVYRTATKAERAILDRMKADFLEKGFEPFKKAADKALLNRIHDNMDFVVKDMGPAAHHGQFWSPQPSHTFALRYIADMTKKGQEPSPGFIAARIARGEIRTPPKSVLDSPTLTAMRGKMEALSRAGKLKEGVYSLYKGYRDQTGKMVLEYELYATPGTKFKVADPTWYAPGDVPKTYITSRLHYEGVGPKVAAGDRLPTYWFASEKAAGKGVPSLAQMYLSKVFGDITLIRQYAPWNLRPARWALKGESDVYSPSPFISSYTPIAFHAVKAGKGGRATSLIKGPDGKVLLTRTLGQNRYDLPGGSSVKRGLRSEPLRKAAERELWEEVGVKADYLDHVDTFTGKFTGKGKDYTFQVFEGFSRGKPKPGSEIAEYVWWDGRSKLRYPVADFVRDTLTRAKVRNQAIDVAVSTRMVRDTFAKGKGKRLEAELAKLDRRMGREVAESLREGHDRGTMPYKPSRATLAALAEGALGIASAARGRRRADIIPERILPYTRMEGRPTVERLLEEARTVEKMPLEKIPKERPPIEKVPKEKVPVERLPKEAIPEEKIPIEKLPKEKLPVEKVAKERIPTEKIPAEKIPAEKVPTEKVPVVKTPKTLVGIGSPRMEIRRVEGIPERDPGVVTYNKGIVSVEIKPPYREGTEDIDFKRLKEPQRGKGSQERTLGVRGGDPPDLIVLSRTGGIAETHIIGGKKMRHMRQSVSRRQRGPGLLRSDGKMQKQKRGTILK